MFVIERRQVVMMSCCRSWRVVELGHSSNKTHTNASTLIVHSSSVIQNKSYWRIRISPIVDRLTKKRAHQQKLIVYSSELRRSRLGRLGLASGLGLASVSGFDVSVSPRINWQTPRSRLGLVGQRLGLGLEGLVHIPDWL